MSLCKCSNTECKLICWRKYKPDSDWQPWSNFELNEDGTCDDFKPYRGDARDG